jgi:hypothetical protein
LNTVLIGGDCGRGEAYGYISWVDDQAVLTARNPDRRAQSLEVPFDATVYYRGDSGQPYHARVVYPFIEEMPWTFTSGKPFSVEVPGDTALILEIEPGSATAKKAATPPPLPPAEAHVGDDSFTIRLSVPNEETLRYDLLVQVWGAASPQVTINGQAATPRLQDGGHWTLCAYDLREHRGRELLIEGLLTQTPDAKPDERRSLQMDVWVVADRSVDAPVEPSGKKLPFPISQQFRRQTLQLISKSIIGAAP